MSDGDSLEEHGLENPVHAATPRLGFEKVGSRIARVIERSREFLVTRSPVVNAPPADTRCVASRRDRSECLEGLQESALSGFGPLARSSSEGPPLVVLRR